MIKTLFWHQYLLHLGLEIFFSHHYLYQKNVPNYFSFIFQIWGPPLRCTSDRPCQLIIFPIEKSCTNFFSVSPARFLFLLLAPPPHHFSNGPPLNDSRKQTVGYFLQLDFNGLTWL
jgi:hypothetical protein